jgi:CRISPR-associated endonuclease/helicase Cas3
VRSPEDAQGILRGLKDEKGGLGAETDTRVCLLTGTIRGFERDRMARENHVFKAFLSDSNWLGSKNGQGTIYLVSTSAGEVGVDFDADHLVCDLTTLDSLAQRFGRVNRLGGKGRSASITLMYPRPEEAKTKRGTAVSKEDDKLDALVRWAVLLFGVSAKAAKAWVPSAERLMNSLEAVQQLPRKNGTFDASPHALRSILGRTEAFSPTPAILSTTDIVLDNWSLTSIKDGLPGRPEVEPYLHGLEKDLPETYVAWRADVEHLADAKPTTGDLEEILDAYPVKPWERLRDSTYRVRKQLAELAGEDRGEGENKAPVGNMPAIIVDSGGRPTLTTIGKLASDNGPRLTYSTIILPVLAGGLSVSGTLDPGPSFPAPESLMDVADHTSDPTQTRLRVLLARGDDGWAARCIAPPQAATPPTLPPESFEDARTLIEAIVKHAGMANVHELSIGGDETSEPDYILLYLVSAGNPDIPSNNAPRPQGLEEHSVEVEKTAESIGKAIFDPDASPVREALILAAKWHDKGKNRRIWQRAISNTNPEEPLAKSGRRGANWRLLRGYRHEFGSLHEAAAASEIAKHPECDLILHLIAAHHGWARPHFEAQGFDSDPKYSSALNEQAAAEVLRRYARLQRRFGRWGLAWLESLLRCADAMASVNPDPSKRGEA